MLQTPLILLSKLLSEVEEMTEKELCLMCESYSEDTKCDQKDNCKLMAVLKENRALKKKVS